MQNLITKWFTIEYALWFSFFLPGLASMDAPIPLGGTSNHFRRLALQSMGAWDPFNVTEDADLGIRMFREGYTVGVLESTTYEEANSDFVNWMKQRSRWLKGYIQTFLVHLRHPVELQREMGLKNVGHFCMFVGGTPILAIINPIFWLMTIVWFVAHPDVHRADLPGPDLLPGPGVVRLRELPAGLRDGHELPHGPPGHAALGGTARPDLLGDDVHGRHQGRLAAGRRAELLGEDGPRAAQRAHGQPERPVLGRRATPDDLGHRPSPARSRPPGAAGGDAVDGAPRRPWPEGRVRRNGSGV